MFTTRSSRMLLLAALHSTLVIAACHAPIPSKSPVVGKVAAAPHNAAAVAEPASAATPSPPAPAPTTPTPPPQPTATESSGPTLPLSVDLRPRLESMGLTPRPQGTRGTCSIFTTCESIEFAYSKFTGTPTRLSPEFLNWAGWQRGPGELATPSDGNFFHNALAGFEKHGVCTETSMPYQPTFDQERVPSADAIAQASRIRDESRGNLTVHWIVPWQPGRFGVDPEQFAEIKRVLASGYPVAAGSGHSRLLVGYRDDAGHPAGGVFLTEDSALNRFDEVPYDFVRDHVADVFWIEALQTHP